MVQPTKAKINLKEGVIELEGGEDFVRGYLDEFKELLKSPQRNELPQQPLSPKAAVRTKAPAKKSTLGNKATSKKAAPKVSMERFDIYGNNDIPSLSKFMEEKNPGTANGNIIAVIGYYITDILGNGRFTEGQIEYAYKMLKLKRPAHLRQIMINEKNKRDLFEVDGEDSTQWGLTRTGEIYVSDVLPES